MKIDELINELINAAKFNDIYGREEDAELMRKSAEVIGMLWEVAKDTNNAKYKMQFDEWIGESHDN